jgi:type I restriction enzyme S subunit
MRDGWKALPLSDVVEHTIGGVWGAESGTDEIEVTVVRSTEFTKRGYLNFETGVSRSIKLSQLKSRELKVGDILLEKSGGGPDQPVGRVVYVTGEIPSKFVCSNFVQLVRPNSKIVEPLFLFHIMWQWHAINRTLEFQAQTTGIRNLRTPDYLEQEINLPPLPEQKRIVDLISSVDSYIEALQQQLESAKRSRNAVLHELLTAGGDDWETTTIGDISDFISVRKSPEQLSSDSIYVGLEHLEPNNTSINNFDSVSKVASSLTPFDVGDVLFGRLRPYLHKVAIAEMFGFCSPEILVLRANSKVLPQMLLLFCDADSTIKICVERSAGTRMPRTSTEDLASIEIKLPPIVEQIKLAELSSTFDTDISHLGIALEKSKILRSGLLSDLLSGTHEIPASYDKVMGAA